MATQLSEMGDTVTGTGAGNAGLKLAAAAHTPVAATAAARARTASIPRVSIELKPAPTPTGAHSAPRQHSHHNQAGRRHTGRGCRGAGHERQHTGARGAHADDVPHGRAAQVADGPVGQGRGGWRAGSGGGEVVGGGWRRRGISGSSGRRRVRGAAARCGRPLLPLEVIGRGGQALACHGRGVRGRGCPHRGCQDARAGRRQQTACWRRGDAVQAGGRTGVVPDPVGRR